MLHFTVVKSRTLWVGLRIILNLIISWGIKVFGCLWAGSCWSTSASCKCRNEQRSEGMKLRSQGAIKTILCITCNFECYESYTAECSIGMVKELLSMMVSTRFQSILFLLCAAHEKKGQYQLIKQKLRSFQELIGLFGKIDLLARAIGIQKENWG